MSLSKEEFADLLVVKDLTKSFNGNAALSRVSFSLRNGGGGVVLLVGPNGAGKTTFLDVVCGFLRPDLGQVFFEGRDVTNLPSEKTARAGVTRSFQEIRVLRQMTVMDNLVMASRCFVGIEVVTALLKDRKGPHEIRERAGSILNEFDLYGKRDRLAKDLSFGEMKLVGLGRALMKGGRLFLLDEPIAGLSERAMEKVIQIIASLVRDGKAVVAAEHKFQPLLNFCERMVVLCAGEKIADGLPHEVLAGPSTTIIYAGQGHDA